MSKRSLNFPTLLWIASALLILASIIAGLVITGGPGHQRQLKLDEKRTQRLEALYFQVNTYYQSEGQLPDTLEQMAARPSMKGWSINTTDPVTGEPFTYRPLSEKTYELCARFELASPKDGTDLAENYPYERSWTHPAGLYCFQLETKDVALNGARAGHM